MTEDFQVVGSGGGNERTCRVLLEKLGFFELVEVPEHLPLAHVMGVHQQVVPFHKICAQGTPSIVACDLGGEECVD